MLAGVAVTAPSSFARARCAVLFVVLWLFVAVLAAVIGHRAACAVDEAAA